MFIYDTWKLWSRFLEERLEPKSVNIVLNDSKYFASYKTAFFFPIKIQRLHNGPPPFFFTAVGINGQGIA